MVKLQDLTGARPQEVVACRPCEVDKSGDVWVYQPRSHKTAHLDRGKVFVFGQGGAAALARPRSRDLLLRAGGDLGLELRAAPAAGCVGSQLERRRVEGPEAGPGAALHPAQLSQGYPARLPKGGHPGLVAPAAAAHAGHADPPGVRLEAAMAVPGHAGTKITEIYAERDLELAMRIMREIG